MAWDLLYGNCKFLSRNGARFYPELRPIRRSLFNEITVYENAAETGSMNDVTYLSSMSGSKAIW